MARQKQLSKEKRVAIITLRNEGQSVRKIGKTLKVSPSAVAKTIKHYKETGSHEDRPRKGRPGVTSAAEDKFIRVTSLRNRRLAAARIRDQVNATQTSSSRHISATTVKRRLCESGRIAARKPLLRTGNKQKLWKGYLTQKESDGVLRQMSWPQSPDLNPIEMVWGELDRRVKAKGPTSARHLWELLQDCWKTILVKRMPRVCEAVITAKGGYFEEPRI
uniref:Transposase IS30-like HTH domain-containing protein n=1 Tax=Poecilia formosa TaxID=48698 RepID=A0A096MC38_POEFO